MNSDGEICKSAIDMFPARISLVTISPISTCTERTAKQRRARYRFRHIRVQRQSPASPVTLRDYHYSALKLLLLHPCKMLLYPFFMGL